MRIVAANMRDGEAIGSHDRDLSVDIARATRDTIGVKRAAGQLAGPLSADVYLSSFQDVINGPVIARRSGYPIFGGSPFLFQGREHASAPTALLYTSVATVEHWLSLLSDLEGRRIFGRRRWRSRSGARDPLLLQKLQTERSGVFWPDDTFRFGNPVAWFTPREDFDTTTSNLASRADAARDVLGLVHRETGAHLVALHFPADVIADARGARPTFADAGTHRRFMCAAAGAPPPFPRGWGQTLDLKKFEAEQLLADGAPERVSATITGAMLAGAAVQFEYLGACLKTRGSPMAAPPAYGTDADFAAAQVKRGVAAFDALVDEL